MAAKPVTPEAIASELFERLDLILRVLALQVGAGKSLTERAILLKTAGMDNDSIARVLNTTNATVRTLTSNSGSRLRLRTRVKRKK
jgi:DNA-binding NarL/FixJ family response regulator